MVSEKPKKKPSLSSFHQERPSSHSVPNLLLHHFHKPCDLPFFNSILDLDEKDDGFLSFGGNIPPSSLNKLYIRECYRTMASSVYLEENKAIINGTPGTGKTFFIIYLLWKLVKKRERVLIIYHPYNIYYDGNGGVFQFTGGHLPRDSDASFWNKTLWCLFDDKDKTVEDLNKFPYDLCRFVISTSPQREMLYDFKKPPVPLILYMPTWALEEMEQIAPLYYPKVMEWRDRFESLGGIPRYVLESMITQTPDQILKAACRVCSLDDCIKGITEESRVVGILVHIQSVHPYTDPLVEFASERALATIVECKGKDAKRRMKELLASCEGNPFTAVLCGYMFELYTMELLERGGTFTCRQLVDGKKKQKPSDESLVIPSSDKTPVKRVEANQTRNVLHVPISRNHAAFDAWIPGIGAFQFTVRMKPDIKQVAASRNDLNMLGGESKILYWCVPRSNYHDFTKKATPKGIDQYAILIDYPNYDD